VEDVANWTKCSQSGWRPGGGGGRRVFCNVRVSHPRPHVNHAKCQPKLVFRGKKVAFVKYRTEVPPRDRAGGEEEQ